MQKLFGIPIDNLLYGLLITLALGLVVLMVSALRNPVLFKTGARNILRRPAQTSLIVLGLMLATLLFSSALVTGDTMNYSIKKMAIDSLGVVDVTVQVKNKESSGNRYLGGMSAQAVDTYFGKDKYEKIADVFEGDDRVDGLTAGIQENMPALAPKSKQTIPQVSVIGVENDYSRDISRLKTSNGVELKIADLEDNEVYINKEAAEKLDVKESGDMQLFMAGRPYKVEVAGVFETGGQPSSGPALVLPVERMQRLTGKNGKYNTLLISGKGDELTGVEETDHILGELKPALKNTGLEAKDVKRDTLKQADEAAAAFASIFLIFGQFSMIAGVMLIFLIFVMLAAERKVELGVLRALGSQRRDILRIFTYEGVVYAVLAGAVGAALGLGVGWGMVRILTRALGNVDSLKLVFHVEPKSVVISYALGVIATFVVVFFSAWRAGSVNIVRAIRDLPEPTKNGRTIKSAILAIVLLFFGGILTISGLQSKQMGAFMMGTSFLIVGLPLLARFVRLPDRAAFTIAGLGLVIWWLLPDGSQQALGIPEMKAGIEMFFISGVSLVTGAIWAVMYNSDILLKIVVGVFGRLKGLPPMLRIAVNYPMRSRFRTGMALAMFALIIFTMVFMGTIIDGVGSIYQDIDGLSGGFHIQGMTGYANTVKEPFKTIKDKGDGIKESDIAAIGSFSMAGAEIRQTGVKSKKWINYAVQGVDEAYGEKTSYEIKLKDSRYKSGREVWRALQTEKNVAIVHAGLVPTKTDYNMGDQKPDFMLSGFDRNDKKLPATYIEVKEPTTGKVTKLKVIGMIEDMALYVYNGVITSQKTVDEIAGRPVPPTTFWFRLKDGVDGEKAAKALSKTFYESGMSTTVLEKNINNLMETNQMMNRLLQGFLGLGLVVGIAALGVIAARSVVERRQQIGVLRAIGFRRGMVQATFLLESSYVALLGIVLGSLLGLMLSYNSMSVFEKEMPGIKFSWPWMSVAVIGLIAYAASLLTTFLPARQASKVYPAEALRYE